MDTLKEVGLWYISNRKVKHNDAVMFDIDDTLIFTNGRANEPIIDLLHASQKLGYKISLNENSEIEENEEKTKL